MSFRIRLPITLGFFHFILQVVLWGWWLFVPTKMLYDWRLLYWIVTRSAWILGYPCVTLTCETYTDVTAKFFIAIERISPVFLVGILLLLFVVNSFTWVSGFILVKGAICRAVRARTINKGINKGK